MTVGELIQELAPWRDCEVRLAMQPSYPFQHNVANVAAVEIEEGGEPKMVVYIAEGGQYYAAPYLPGTVRDELGW